MGGPDINQRSCRKGQKERHCFAKPASYEQQVGYDSFREFVQNHTGGRQQPREDADRERDGIDEPIDK